MNYLGVVRSGNRGPGGVVKSPPAIDTAAATAAMPSGTTSGTASQSLPPPSAEGVSTRSRASSIFSTGTKTSINTLPVLPPHAESHSGPIDVVVGRRNFRITARPGSILSISSFDHPAPPYAEATGDDASQSTDTLTAASVAEEPDDDEPPSVEQPTPLPLRLHAPILQAPRESISEELESASQSRSPSPPSPPLSPLTSSTNAISAHYTAVVRTIDTNHRAEIERLRTEYEVSLAQTRNDIDAAYRIPFREARQNAEARAAEAAVNKELAEERAAEIASLKSEAKSAEKELTEFKASTEKEVRGLRDEIEKLKADVERMKHEAEAQVHRARNQVEDVWEGRWRDRMRLAAEQVKGSWEDGRDSGWYEGMLQGCRNIEAIWERTEGKTLPPSIKEEVDKWKTDAERRRPPSRR